MNLVVYFDRLAFITLIWRHFLQTFSIVSIQYNTKYRVSSNLLYDFELIVLNQKSLHTLLYCKLGGNLFRFLKKHHAIHIPHPLPGCSKEEKKPAINTRSANA